MRVVLAGAKPVVVDAFGRGALLKWKRAQTTGTTPLVT
jgi:hypothetical protein